ncbi:MAG: hypothetical protein ACYTG0_24230 [Planctomycetota bacterium]|jgi:hypothetical protein
MGTKHHIPIIGPAVLLAGLALAFGALGLVPAIAGEEAVFEMREISVFDKLAEEDGGGPRRYQLMNGQHASCTPEPNDEVKAYPKLKSRQPLYGTLAVQRSLLNPTDTLDLHFVIDASGEAPADTPAEKAPAEESSSLLSSPTEARTGEAEQSAQVARQGGESWEVLPYDRLYFDANRDLDLTNDPVVKLMEDPPSGALMPGEEQQKNVRVFDYLNVPFDHGLELGTRPFCFLPKLTVVQQGGYMMFMPTTARQGEIRIGSRRYEAVLAQSTCVTGRFDAPFTNLLLTPLDKSEEQEEDFWLGAGWVSLMREVDGQLYRVTTTPAGDKLTVSPYRGDYGVFEVGPGTRAVDKLGAAGMFISEDQAMVILGSVFSPASVEKKRQARLPVGDYAPMALMVDFGRLGVRLSLNPYSADGSRASQEKSPTFGIEIRKDKPFVLDFSNKPHVLFTGPSPTDACREGQSVQIEAVLLDPKLDLLIAGLEDTTQETGQMEFTDENGNQVKMPRYASLDPTVVITDPSGKEVASGKMPFG